MSDFNWKEEFIPNSVMEFVGHVLICVFFVVAILATIVELF